MIPRPNRHDPAVIAAAFEKIWPEIKKWIGDTGSNDEENRESAKRVLENSFGDDGYELAKDFDHAHFSPDSELVDILDGWSGCTYHAHQDEIKKWAKENPIEPHYAVGAVVSFDAGYRFKSQILTDGRITAVDTALQVYTINSQTAGHVVPGSGKSGVTGSFANFEDLHKLNTKVPDAV